MVAVAAELNKIWRIFRAMGIAEDLAIIEHIAALLVAQEKLPQSAEDLRPRPPQLPPQDLSEIQAILHELSEQLTSAERTGAAELFDRYVLFRLPESLPGERYPTPRHIVRFMHSIATIGSDDSLLDLACGSGGMLALRMIPTNEQVQTVGIEISPVWARLAWANCMLHGLTNVRISIEDAIVPGTTDISETFSRVLMNPPFGTRATRQGERAGRSETILTQRALAFVSGAGRLCTLIPSGMLFGGGMEKQLRIQFVDDYSLNAIISLPKVAFQPYSGLQTHLLLVTKSEPQDSASTWFLRAERDGYTSGRGRDLTKDTDAKTSDFPLIEMLLAWDGVWSNTSDQLPLRYQRLTVGQDSALVVGGSAPGVVTRIERYDAGSQHILLINSLYNAQTVTQIINVSEGKLELLAADREATLKAKLSLEKKEVLPPAVLLLREEDQGISVVVASDGRLIGTRLLCENLRQADYDLRVERYVRAEEIRAAARPPAELLADIRANQRGFTRRIDSLLGRLEAPRISDDKLIAPVWLPPIGLPMIELLNNDQRTIWNIVVSLTLQVTQNTSIQNSQQEIYEVPDYFTIETLIENGIDMPEAEIEKAIDLFVQMGLVVFANLPGSAERRLVVYRLVSERDIWKPRSTTNAEVTP